MVNGLDPRRDESSTKTLDRLLRYAVRPYARAMDELRKIQTQRALSNHIFAPRDSCLPAAESRAHVIIEFSPALTGE